MNLFLRCKKVLQVKEHLVNNEAEGVFWCFCVRYVDDVYQDLQGFFKLNPQQFTPFSIFGKRNVGKFMFEQWKN